MELLAICTISLSRLLRQLVEEIAIRREQLHTDKAARISGKPKFPSRIVDMRKFGSRRRPHAQNYLLWSTLTSSGGRVCKYQIRVRLLRRGIFHCLSIGTY